jgi:predicted NAD-dependent protein-ADP-ribosyltransferase YbiA (DUF1768 family)
MSQDPIDIKAKAPFPAGALSNFAPYSFSLDGIACQSMEGFLQSLKIEDSAEQAGVCSLAGAEAQNRPIPSGHRRNWSA